MNRRFAEHLQYHVGWYLLVLIAAVFFWSTVFTVLAQPEDSERLVVSYFGDSLNTEGFRSHLQENQEAITSQPLKEISLSQCTGDNLYISAIAMARAQASDIVIVEETLLELDSSGEAMVPVTGNFRPFTPEMLAAVLNILPESLEFYQVEGEIYGIWLPTSGQSRFEVWQGSGARCVLFFGVNSVNLSGLYAVSDTQNRAALDLAEYLLEESNG